MKVSVETVQHFARLAAETQAPRYLRFLSTITLPMGKAIPRNQETVISALAERPEALLLYQDDAGRAQRQKMIDAGDLTNNNKKRGKLAYHVELIGLIASVTAAVSAAMNEITLLHKKYDSRHWKTYVGGVLR